MKKFLIFTSLIFSIFISETNAQNRDSVSAAEVNGTYRLYFSGKFKDSYNEVRILALGKGKLRVAFNLLYPYMLGLGGRSAHLGDAKGEATIEGDTAVFTSEEFGECRITIKFLKPGTIKITQKGSDAECGFGHNVTAKGTYEKSSKTKPTFSAP